MEQRGKIPGCFKFGCFSCLALVALFVGVVLLIGTVQLTTDVGEPNPVERQASHDLPTPPEALTPEAPVDPSSDRPPAIELEPLPEQVDFETPPAPGVLRLDLRMGEFIIRPGEPGEPLKVEADYDESSFELTEEFQQNDDGTWTYDVAFGGRGGFLGVLFRGGAEGSRNRVEITIPRGHPVAIVGEIGMGESEIDLGGLWIERVDLEMSAGDHYLEFREPLPVPMGEFLIDSSMGSLEINDLGQASPSSVVVDHGMGELAIDLAGAWQRDASIDVDFSMGECRLYLPEGARVEIDRASVGLGEKRIASRDDSALPADAPTLTLRLSGSMGELRVED